MVTHNLKTWPDVFHAIKCGAQTHEFRENDRDFEEGDVLVLREFQPIGEIYTGQAIRATITTIYHGPQWGVPEGFSVMSIRVDDLGYEV